MHNKERELTIRLPESLLRQLDIHRALENKGLNEFLQETIQQVLCEKVRCHLHETMRAGYEEMGAINLSLAEMGVCQEHSLLEDYERYCCEWKIETW